VPAVRRFLLTASVGLAATLCAGTPAWATHNADMHSPNAALISAFNDGGRYQDGSDLAFWGDRLIAGNYQGFRVLDISDPANPVELGDVACPGTQGDVSTWNDLVFVSVDASRTGPECGSAAASAAQQLADTDWEGIRVFNIADPANPTQVAAVDTDCGSHTHTLMPDEANGRVLIYVQSYPLGAPLPDCNVASHRKVSVVEVPLSNPAAARVSGSFNVSPAIGCHDTTVLIPNKIAGSACIDESQLWDISDPANPRVISHIANPAINIHHSTTFSWDGKTLVIGDELAGATVAPGCGPGGDHIPIGALWFYDVSNPSSPQPKATYRIPQTVASVLCTAHNFNMIPLTSGKQILVSAWYDGGATMVDFTDPTSPRQLAFYIARTPAPATNWSSYWYNGIVYSNNHSGQNMRGIDAMTFSDPDVAGALTLPRLNPQTMEPLPAGPGVAGGLISTTPQPSCHDRIRPRSRFRRRTLRANRRGIRVRGTASDRGCRARGRGKVEHVLMSVARRVGGGRCRHVQTTHERARPHLGPVRSCRIPNYGRAENTPAEGTSRWLFKLRVNLPPGTYTIRSRAVDSAANIEKKRRLRGKRRQFLTIQIR